MVYARPAAGELARGNRPPGSEMMANDVPASKTGPDREEYMGEYALGQPVTRFEDPRLLRGGGRYVDDLALPNMAHGAVLRARHAHARILKLDVSRARNAPGVLCCPDT